MAKKLSSWNLFVKKIYAEGKSKNPNYKFKQALADASNRKSEMKSSGASSASNVSETTDASVNKTKKRKSKKQKKNSKTRRRR